MNKEKKVKSFETATPKEPIEQFNLDGETVPACPS